MIWLHVQYSGSSNTVWIRLLFLFLCVSSRVFFYRECNSEIMSAQDALCHNWHLTGQSSCRFQKLEWKKPIQLAADSWKLTELRHQCASNNVGRFSNKVQFPHLHGLAGSGTITKAVRASTMKRNCPWHSLMFKVSITYSGAWLRLHPATIYI